MDPYPVTQQFHVMEEKHSGTMHRGYEDDHIVLISNFQRCTFPSVAEQLNNSWPGRGILCSSLKE